VDPQKGCEYGKELDLFIVVSEWYQTPGLGERNVPFIKLTKVRPLDRVSAQKSVRIVYESKVSVVYGSVQMAFLKYMKKRSE